MEIAQNHAEAPHPGTVYQEVSKIWLDPTAFPRLTFHRPPPPAFDIVPPPVRCGCSVCKVIGAHHLRQFYGRTPTTFEVLCASQTLARLKAPISQGYDTLVYEGAVKLKCFACLLCLLLFVAAIDNVPDPPAVNPRSSESSRVSPLPFHASFTLPEKGRFIASASIRPSQIARFACRLDFNTELVDICSLALVRHAADSSPPRSS